MNVSTIAYSKCWKRQAEILTAWDECKIHTEKHITYLNTYLNTFNDSRYNGCTYVIFMPSLKTVLTPRDYPSTCRYKL